MRSKALLVSNILATIYAAVLLWIVGGAVIQAGGIDFLVFWQQYFGMIFRMFGNLSASAAVVYTVVILLFTHVIAFVLGALFGWLGFLSKKSGAAKFAAVLYLIGTLCLPVLIFFGLPVTVIGFIGGGNQKKLNRNTVEQ